MEKAEKNIYPGKGLGVVKFGMTPEQVESILGKPSEIKKGDFEVPNEEEEDFFITWHYDEEEISMEFEKIDEVFRLVILSVTSEEFIYNGQTLIGKTWAELKPHLSELHLSKDESEEENSFVQFSDLLNISFWFEEEMLTEVQWTQVLSDVDMN